MTSSDIWRYIVIPILAPIIPTLLLIFSGRLFLKRFEEKQRRKEQEVELLRSVREQQYKAVELGVEYERTGKHC